MSSLIGSLVNTVVGAPAWLVYALVGAAVFAEDALFVGFVLPGETLVLVGGVTAALGHTSYPVVLAVVVVMAVLGDAVGYEVGRHLGRRVLAHRWLDGHRPKIDVAAQTLERRGGPAVFLARWTAFLRAVTPALAGMSGMAYRRFLPWNLAGGIAWGTAVVTAGYLAGHSYRRVQVWLGHGAAAMLLLVVAGALVWWALRRRRKEPVAL